MRNARKVRRAADHRKRALTERRSKPQRNDMNKPIANHTHAAARQADGTQAGFTLVEAMIAMFVTVVGLVSIAGMFTMAMRTNASSRNMTTATTFAQDKLEQLGAVSFERLVDPSKMKGNPNSRGADDAYAVGALDQDVTSGGIAYFDKIILAGRHDIE